MKVLKVVLITLSILALVANSSFAKNNEGNEPKGKGAGLENAQIQHEKHENKAKKQIRSQAPSVPKQILRNIPSHVPNKSLEQDRSLARLKNALQKLERSRWAYNPHDTRGQGNMGRPDMLDPYGHDKDSDRMELYGNRGRVIREPELPPEPDPELPPEPEPELPPEPEPEPPPEPDPYYPPF